MVRREVLPSGGRLLLDDSTQARVWLETPTVVAWIISGHGTMDVVKQVVVELEELAPKQGSFLVFNDTERMPGYDPGFRNILTEWSKSKAERLTTIHILTASRVVAMGAAVANMLLGGNIKMYSERSAFESAFVGAGGTRNQFQRVA